jgi:hypothetical protein
VRRWLPPLVGTAAALVTVAVLFGVETHLFAGADALIGVLGALAIGYTAKTLAALGLSRPAPSSAIDQDD